MGKAAKRERQKSNKLLKEEQQARAQSRAQVLRFVKGFVLVAILPIIIAVSMVINNMSSKDKYTATIKVTIEGEAKLPNNGIIEVELDNVNAPKSVKHFVGFASNGYYDGLTWHRAVKDFVIQGGDPEGTGTGRLGTSIVSELPENGYKSGDLAWAKGSNEPAGTAGSQFFIITGKDSSNSVKSFNKKATQSDGSESYEYGYIGRVTKGLAAAVAIEELAPEEGDGAPTKKAFIASIKIKKNGKLMKRGDVSAPTTTTSSTTTTPSLATPSTPESTEQ